MDALDRVASKTFSKEDKRQWAIKKSGEEETKFMTNAKVVNLTSQKYRDHIAAERKRLGLDP